MPADGETTAVIRAATSTDVDAVVALCAEHAAYEGNSFVDHRPRAEALGRALCAEPPRLWCLVVDAAGAISGYATHALEFSTWQAAEYLHVDCLYLQPQVRGAGIGADIMRRLAAHAGLLGVRRKLLPSRRA
jgi:L-amino acid N-acyltransferase YncA